MQPLLISLQKSHNVEGRSVVEQYQQEDDRDIKCFALEKAKLIHIRQQHLVKLFGMHKELTLKLQRLKNKSREDVFGTHKKEQFSKSVKKLSKNKTKTKSIIAQNTNKKIIVNQFPGTNTNEFSISSKAFVKKRQRKSSMQISFHGDKIKKIAKSKIENSMIVEEHMPEVIGLLGIEPSNQDEYTRVHTVTSRCSTSSSNKTSNTSANYVRQKIVFDKTLHKEATMKNVHKFGDNCQFDIPKNSKQYDENVEEMVSISDNEGVTYNNVNLSISASSLGCISPVNSSHSTSCLVTSYQSAMNNSKHLSRHQKENSYAIATNKVSSVSFCQSSACVSNLSSIGVSSQTINIPICCITTTTSTSPSKCIMSSVSNQAFLPFCNTVTFTSCNSTSLLNNQRDSETEKLSQISTILNEKSQLIKLPNGSSHDLSVVPLNKNNSITSSLNTSTMSGECLIPVFTNMEHINSSTCLVDGNNKDNMLEHSVCSSAFTPNLVRESTLTNFLMKDKYLNMASNSLFCAGIMLLELFVLQTSSDKKRKNYPTLKNLIKSGILRPDRDVLSIFDQVYAFKKQ